MDILTDLRRRDVLKWAAACGVGCLFGARTPPAWAQQSTPVAQDAPGPSELPGVKLKGVVRHPAMFWEALEPRADKKIRCGLCPRQCVVGNEERGTCGVRENQDGAYQTLVYGTLCSANVDPIEKKPLFHYLPGSNAFSVATAGCNIECRFCQNWQISQFRPEQVESVRVGPADLVAAARARNCPTLAYTYSEPVVFYEFMHAAAEAGRAAGIGSVAISNGYIQEKPLRQLCRHLTGIKIDLKAFTEEFYQRQCSAELKPVLATLEVLKDTGIWFELVILIIPTLNDSAAEIRRMASWVVQHLGPDVPMHFTRFHPTYRLTNLPATPVQTLETARQIALDAGVRYVYAGNVPLHPGENTYCHSCRTELIRRVGFQVTSNTIQVTSSGNSTGGKCPKCGTTIPGVWSQPQALAFQPREPAPPRQPATSAPATAPAQ